MESPWEPAVVLEEATALVDGCEHVEIVHLRELEVLATAAGRDVDDPGTGVERDVGPGDDAVPDLPPRIERVERPFVTETDELGSLHDHG